MKSFIQLLILFGCLTLVGQAFSSYHCPKKIAFKCIKQNASSKYTVCTITSGVRWVWNFAAPDKVLSTKNPSASLHKSGQKSQSILPPGTYNAEYKLAYYGPVVKVPYPSAYCFYDVKNYFASAGLFSMRLIKKGKKRWQKTMAKNQSRIYLFGGR